MLRDGLRESKRNSCISPMAIISRNASRLTRTNLNSMKWMLLERRCGNGGIRNDRSANSSFQYALGTPLTVKGSKESKPS